MSQKENESSEKFIFDLHLDTPNMYDSVSSFPVVLDSYGTYNTQYNCLQKVYGGTASSSAASLSLINHPSRLLDPSKYTETSKFIIRVQFIAYSYNGFSAFVPFGFPEGTHTYNWGASASYFSPYIQPYSMDRIINFEITQIGSGPIEECAYDESFDLLASKTTQTTINYYKDRFVNRVKTNSNIVLLPAPYSPQKNNQFYIKKLQVSVIE
jgi:hypothetical protein